MCVYVCSSLIVFVVVFFSAVQSSSSYSFKFAFIMCYMCYSYVIYVFRSEVKWKNVAHSMLHARLTTFVAYIYIYKLHIYIFMVRCMLLLLLLLLVNNCICCVSFFLIFFDKFLFFVLIVSRSPFVLFCCCRCR